jgi:hypothetical protein
MPTDPLSSMPRSRPTRETAAFQHSVRLRRQVWSSALFLAWGAFELGRWTEAPNPWLFSPVFGGCLGALMLVAAVFLLRRTLDQLGADPGVDTPNL